jgi:AcrR family transcriptional regulator
MRSAVSNWDISTASRLTATDRRSQILAAAMELFSERGFHGTKTRDLARTAGVSEALLFRHFPTKEALIHAILENVTERYLRMEAKIRGIPPREALIALAEVVLSSLRENPKIFRVVFFGVLEKPEFAREFYRSFLSRMLTLESRLFRRAFATKRASLPASRIDPRVVARSFHGSLLFHNLAGAILRVEPLPRNPRALAESIVSLYLPEGRP